MWNRTMICLSTIQKSVNILQILAIFVFRYNLKSTQLNDFAAAYLLAFVLDQFLSIFSVKNIIFLSIRKEIPILTKNLSLKHCHPVIAISLEQYSQAN